MDGPKFSVQLGKPVRFLALEWREDWEFDHPSVLLEPFVRYSPCGEPCESLIEDAAIDVAVDGGEVAAGMHPSEAKEFAWRGWSVEELRRVAEECLANPGSAKLGTGYVAAKEQWIVFRTDVDGISFDYVEG